jgi:enoyl-CoA hydratase
LRPTFDASLALEFLGFSGPEATEGLASHLEKRKPSFPPTSAI